MLILASRSPQRRAILEQLGVAFEVVIPDVEEREDGDPREMVVENALRKARAAEGDLVLGVDTTVVLDGLAYGKPKDEADAERVLELLSGRTHEVWSG
ncbi:MAG: nucleoside triphosphate pyrophosphatase, partial [Thermoleophilaceae bacterium]|nr:nucleoside triphosphate pyrophosphatase [Thermoleophilaceae bacterium]